MFLLCHLPISHLPFQLCISSPPLSFAALCPALALWFGGHFISISVQKTKQIYVAGSLILLNYTLFAYLIGLSLL